MIIEEHMLKKLKIAIAQITSYIADVSANCKRVCEMIAEAEKAEVDLLIFPELTLTGYIPLDLLYYKKLHSEVSKAIETIQECIATDLHVIFGAPVPVDLDFDENLRFYNSALVLTRNKIIKQVNKILLPNYSVFHEKRYFISDVDAKDNTFELQGMRIGIQICEDMWSNMPFYSWGVYKGKETNVYKRLVNAGAQLIVNISASPYSKRKCKERVQVAKSHVRNQGVPFIYVNAVGAVDEVVFDGGSFVLNKDAEMVYACTPFKDDLFIFNSDQFSISGNYEKNLYMDLEAELIEAIRINLDSYLTNINFTGKLLVAVSGGIDSALTVALCVRTVGSGRVEGIFLPTRYSSNESTEDARELASNLGIVLHELSIEQIFNVLSEVLRSKFGKHDWSVADENIQARIRGLVMMYLANLWDALVIATGNKSEISTGYCTLYGDTVGGKNLIGDLYKTEVYQLARYINEHHPELRIPERTITRPPTAELKDDQLDQDTLPPYDDLDRVLGMMVDLQLSAEQIIEYGEDAELVNRVAMLLASSEFKRDQMVQTVRVSEQSFGKGRIVPVGTRFRNIE